MEIRTLRYFLETAREGNMTRASERLAVSQSTLSKQLKGLEEELGKKLSPQLFHRTDSGGDAAAQACRRLAVHGG